MSWTSLQEAERLTNVYDSDAVGIVRRLFHRLHDVDDLHAHSVGAYSAYAPVTIGAPCTRSNGGAGTSRAQARVAAIGETVERYSSAWLPHEELVRGSFEELQQDRHCLHPEEIQLFSDEQLDDPNFEFSRLGTHDVIEWVESQDVHTGRRTWIPAQLAFLNSSLATEHRIVHPTSNGLAFGSRHEEALCSAILELIERDAVMTAWYNRLTLPLIDIDSDSILKDYFDRHLRPSGLDISVVDLSILAGVPAAVSVVRNTHGETAPLGIGAAASSSPITAAIKAANEAVASRGWAALKQRQGTTLDPQSNWKQTINDFEDHIALYTNETMAERTRFLDSSQERVAVSEIASLQAEHPEDLYQQLAATLAGQGATVYSIDVSSPDVIEGGGAVIRAYSPQLQPLDVSYAARYLGGHRLRQRPVEVGLLTSPSDQFNDLPHPFP
ncbi:MULTISPECIES: YcaO-like family protein [Auritidibacter]|uniref:YcaO-like family protein n=1 Tax=Auritidibacter ignavus TaxID=678932 RepID=A0AAJ6APD8_9MICC|nr:MULTISPECIES: YcaO-like family protein [Auritidibacter]PXA79000.1 hypothetical protein DCC26_06300 [Auritidibacter sp. NML120779]AXR73955.1 hypothetical protein DCC27_006175 [Auritidibacter sp. NML130574]WGH84467.1 YcaO-like family protein [Auritidibacter ignavus]WGH93791.1 YcaO-like family protein [Auritidibacter ignavus]WHS27392.1 YcaO-like family protein [Auritidibacter ignavus]